jgi:hypothetical protein
MAARNWHPVRYSKRLLTRHRILAATGAAAAVVLAVVASYALHPTEHRQASPAAVGNPAAGPGLAGSCISMPLRSQLAAAVQAGASVIVATGTLTGKSVTVASATAGPPAFYAMTLQPVQTLRGPAVASGSAAWVPGPAPGTPATPENSALLAPGGRLFAIVWPKAAPPDLVGPTLQLVPIVGADVVFTPDGCWDVAGLLPEQYQASTPLWPVPRGANFGGGHQAAENGLYTVPLATVRQIAASALSLIVLARPVRAAEQAAQPVVQATARVLQRIDAVHRRSVGWRQLAGLRVVKAAPDLGTRDPLDVIGIDEPQASLGSDDDPVEHIDCGYLKDVLEGPDLRA